MACLRRSQRGREGKGFRRFHLGLQSRLIHPAPKAVQADASRLLAIANHATGRRAVHRIHNLIQWPLKLDEHFGSQRIAFSRDNGVSIVSSP